MNEQEVQRRVLVVDDEPVLREVFKRVIEGYCDYKVITAASGSEALSALDSADESFDLVLSDLTMQPMDGIALFYAIQVKHPGQKVCFITGAYDDEKKKLERVMRDGVCGLITKPVGANDLASTVRELVEPAPVQPSYTPE